MGKKKQKRRKKVAAKVDKWMADAEMSEEELILAGLGVMARAVEQRQKKLFKRAIKTGRRIAEIGIPTLASSEADESGDEPVISYHPRGGGWYGIDVDDIEVDRVQGEEDAAARAAELLTAYAALDREEQTDQSTTVLHTGGGWYTIKVRGVPVARVRGKEQAEERFGAIAVT